MVLGIFRSSKSNDDVAEEVTSSSSTKTETEQGDRKAFSAYAQQSGLSQPENEWPSSLIVVPSHRAKDVEYQLPIGSAESNEESSIKVALPLNGDVVLIDGQHFQGKLVSRVRDVPTAPCQSNLISNNDYFQNRSRQYQWSVQGRFKRRIRFDKIVTGQEFDRAFRNKPSSRFVERGLDLLRNKLPDTFLCDLFCDEPRFEHPLLAGCQHFRVDKPEDVEDIPDCDMYGVGDDGNVIEDTSLMNDDSIPQDGVARRKHFSSASNLERYYFETDLVYTFDFYANFFSPARHRLELSPFFSVDLIPYFNGYPLFMSMARIKEKDCQDYLWATEMWHERLLNYDESPGRLTKWLTAKTELGNETVCEETEVEDD